MNSYDLLTHERRWQVFDTGCFIWLSETGFQHVKSLNVTKIHTPLIFITKTVKILFLVTD